MQTNPSPYRQSTGRIGAWRSRALGIAGKTSTVIAALFLAADVAWSATRYEAEAAGNTRVNCGVMGDGAASGGQRAYKSSYSLYGGITFNSISVPAAGAYYLTVCYIDPWDGGRNSYISVNGVPDPLVGPHVALWCPGGSYLKASTTVTLVAGNNTITLYAPPNEWGPHWDYIEISQPGNYITATAASGGSISPSGSVHVEPGASQTFTITPNPFYGIADVLVDEVSNPGAITNGSYTFDNVTAAHSIAATFQLLPEQNVSGRVTDATNGIAGAKVFFKTSPLASVSPYATATTDADGYYTQPLRPAAWYACASADGYALSSDTTFTVAGSPVTDLNITLVADPEWDVLFIATVDQFSTNTPDTPIPTWALNHPTGYNLVTPANQSKGVPTITAVDGVNWLHFDRGLLIGAQDQNAYNFCDGYKLTGIPEDPSLATGVPASGVSIVAVVQPILKADSNINFLWGSSPEHDIVGLYFDGLVLGVNTETGEVVVRRKSGIQNTGIILADGQKTILSLVVQLDGSCKLYKDGAGVWTGAAFGSNPFALLTGSFHQIGVGTDAQDGPTSFNGNIGDVFVYKSALTAVKRGTLETNLGAKFGVTLSRTITASAGTGGTMDPAGTAGRVTVVYGTNQTFHFVANSGYAPYQVTIDGGTPIPAGTSYTFSNVTDDHTIAVSFVEHSTYTITPSAGTGGSITPGEAVEVTPGTDQTFTITANDGYVIDQVLVDGTNDPAAVTSGSYTFPSVAAIHAIHATFKTTFANWIDTLYPALSVKTPEGDPDGDGQNNLMEFALNGNPSNGALNARIHSLTAVASEYSTTDKVLILTIAVRAGTPEIWSPMNTATIDGVKYTIQGGTDLSFLGTIWSNPTVVPATGLPDLTGTGYEYRTFVLQGSEGLPGKGFLRVKVEPYP